MAKLLQLLLVLAVVATVAAQHATPKQVIVELVAPADGTQLRLGVPSCVFARANHTTLSAALQLCILVDGVPLQCTMDSSFRHFTITFDTPGPHSVQAVLNNTMNLASNKYSPMVNVNVIDPDACTPVDKPRKVYAIIIFERRPDLLLLSIASIYDAVDFIVVVESRLDLNMQKKEVLMMDNMWNRPEFTPYMPKVYFFGTSTYFSFMDLRQLRDSMSADGLGRCQDLGIEDEDLLLVTRETELVYPETIRRLNTCTEFETQMPIQIGLQEYYYSFAFVPDATTDRFQVMKPVVMRYSVMHCNSTCNVILGNYTAADFCVTPDYAKKHPEVPVVLHHYANGGARLLKFADSGLVKRIGKPELGMQTLKQLPGYLTGEPDTTSIVTPRHYLGGSSHWPAIMQQHPDLFPGYTYGGLLSMLHAGRQEVPTASPDLFQYPWRHQPLQAMPKKAMSQVIDSWAGYQLFPWLAPWMAQDCDRVYKIGAMRYAEHIVDRPDLYDLEVLKELLWQVTNLPPGAAVMVVNPTSFAITTSVAVGLALRKNWLSRIAVVGTADADFEQQLITRKTGQFVYMTNNTLETMHTTFNNRSVALAIVEVRTTDTPASLEAVIGHLWPMLTREGAVALFGAGRVEKLMGIAPVLNMARGLKNLPDTATFRAAGSSVALIGGPCLADGETVYVRRCEKGPALTGECAEVKHAIVPDTHSRTSRLAHAWSTAQAKVREDLMKAHEVRFADFSDHAHVGSPLKRLAEMDEARQSGQITEEQMKEQMAAFVNETEANNTQRATMDANGRVVLPPDAPHHTLPPGVVPTYPPGVSPGDVPRAAAQPPAAQQQATKPVPPPSPACDPEYALALTNLRLETFIAAFEELGVSCVQDLADVTDDDMAAMGMKKIHRNRLQKFIDELKTRQT